MNQTNNHAASAALPFDNQTSSAFNDSPDNRTDHSASSFQALMDLSDWSFDGLQAAEGTLGTWSDLADASVKDNEEEFEVQAEDLQEPREDSDSDFGWGADTSEASVSIEPENLELAIVDGNSAPDNILSSEWFVIEFNRHKFLAKKSVLMKVSHYFAALLRENAVWKETRHGILILSDWELSTFLVLAHWVNTRDTEPLITTLGLPGNECNLKEQVKLEAKKLNQDLDPYVFWAMEDGVYRLPRNLKMDALIKAWRLGAYFGCPSFQNAVMNKLLDEYSPGAIPLYQMHSLYETEHDESPLRRLMFDSVRFCVEEKVLRDAVGLGAIPQALLADLAVLSLGPTPWYGEDRRHDWHVYRCDYHVRYTDMKECPCPEPKMDSAQHRCDINGNPW